MKKRLSRQEEFDIMKIVLDKFVLLGVLIMGYGFYRVVSTTEDFTYGMLILLSGAIILVIFMVILVREYEFMK